MSSKCPNCRTALIAEHSFCPHCGHDLRRGGDGNPNEAKANTKDDAQVNSGVNNEKTQTRDSQSYLPALVAATMFSASSIIIWSYVYTGYSFDSNGFWSRLVNHSFWLFILPLLVSLFFKRDRRASVFSKVVTVAIVLGIFFLLLGYSEFSYNKDPFTIRLRLSQPCTENVIQQMANYEIPYSLKEKRSRAYCTCLISKITDQDISDIGKGTTEFWSLVKSKYDSVGVICVEESLKIKE